METFTFLTPEISQADLVAFANEKVNLKKEYRYGYREQVRNLRDHLDRYVEEHPDIDLVKLLESGSLPKGTALKTILDIDVALYVDGKDAPEELGPLLEWLVARLRTTYHQMSPQDIYIDDPCIVMKFATGPSVEIAPILYFGDPEWRGYLWDRASRKKILTSIPLHLEFIRKRKETQRVHFRQIIRLLKWWAAQRKEDTPQFSLRSFIIELLVAKLADNGMKCDDYHLALEQFFSYIQRTGLRERIAFSDNYPASQLPKRNPNIVEIFDPVNPSNNLGAEITEPGRQLLVSLAANALDALSYARNSQTKEDALQCWRELMGASFSV